MRKNATSDDTKALIDNEHVYIINNPRVANVYSVYLVEEINESKYYRDLYNILRQSEDTDCFVIYMNNFGGFCHTGIDIINAMRASKGRVCVVLTGPLYSMAPLIALSADIVYIEEDTFMMFHDYSGGMFGKGAEMEKAILHEKPFFDKMFSKITKGFLTKKEIQSIGKGEDLYLDRAQISARLKKIKKLGNKEEVV